MNRPSTTRRAMILAGAAAIPALAIPAVALAASPDPAFAAVEACRKAFAFSRECFDKAGVIEEIIAQKRRELEAIPEEKKQVTAKELGNFFEREGHPLTPEQAREMVDFLGLKVIEDRNDHDEMERLHTEAIDAEAAACWALARTAPITAAGAVAMLRYVTSEADGYDDEMLIGYLDEDGLPLVHTLLASLERFIAGMAVQS